MVNLELLFGQSGMDDKSVRFLLKALERNNLPNFDYLEFKQSIKAMAALNLDEGTAIKSAFATAQTVGMTKEHLIKTTSHYRQVLLNEQKEFSKALDAQVDRRIKGKRREVEQLKTDLQTYEAKIEELKRKIDAAQSKIDSADDDIENETQKIADTRKNFEFALSSILNEMELDIKRFNENL